MVAEAVRRTKAALSIYLDTRECKTGVIASTGRCYDLVQLLLGGVTLPGQC